MRRSFSGVVKLDPYTGQYDFVNQGKEAPYIFGGTVIFYRGYIANSDKIVSADLQTAAMTEAEKYARCFLYAYNQWDKDLSCHLYGEYAVAIFDSKKQKLLFTHDTLGIIPLYYSQSEDQFFFSTHLELLVDKVTNIKLDEEYIADYLCYGDHYGNKTPYVQINRLVPDSAICIINQCVTTHKCSKLGKINPISYSKTQDYADHLRELIKVAVKGAIPTTGNIWCELSGGLDSSTVLCTAIRETDKKRLSSFSFVYPESGTADESVWIQSVIEKCNVNSFELNADAARPFSEYPDDFSPAPYHGMINAALYRKYEELLFENQVDIVLTGMGGDAVLLGDGPEPFFLGDLLRQGRFNKFYRNIKLWTNQGTEGRPARYWIEKCAVQSIFRWSKKQLIQDHPPTITWLNKDYYQGFKRNGKPRKTWVPIQTGIADSWFLERVFRSANVVSHWDHRHTMRAEFRHPLMSWPIIEFMRSIPWDIKFSPISDRKLQRIALENILPDKIVNRYSKGGPDQAIYSGLEKSSDWQQLLSGDTQLSARGYIDSTRWNEAIELAKCGRCVSIKLFKAAATMEVWLRQLLNSY